MRPLISCTFCGLLLAVSSFAQTTVTEGATGGPRRIPALLSSTVPAPEDSRLVRAAKRAVAARMAMNRASSPVIDNLFVQRSHGALSGPSSTSASSTTASSTTPASAPASTAGSAIEATKAAAPRTGYPTSTFDAVAEARRVQALVQEQGRMRMENEQPYGDNVPEDQVTRRLTQIPGEMQTPPPAPPPPMQ